MNKEDVVYMVTLGSNCHRSTAGQQQKTDDDDDADDDADARVLSALPGFSPGIALPGITGPNRVFP